MPIRARCDSCAKQFALKDDLAGKKIRCPNCKAVMAIPAAGASSGGAPKAAKATAKTTAKAAPGGKAPARPRGSAPSTVRKPAPAAKSAQATKGKAPSKGKPAATSGKRSSDTTVAMRDRKPAAGATPPGPSGASACPSCGKAVPTGKVTCPHCAYNIKLGRKLNIGNAISEANQEKGVRADGSRYQTREEKADIRVAKGKRFQIIFFWVAIIAVAYILLRVAYIVYDAASVVEPLSVLRERAGINEKEVSGDPASFHPYWAGAKLDSLIIPMAEIHVEPVPEALGGALSGAASPEAAAARFAETVRPPMAVTGEPRDPRPVLSHAALSVQVVTDELGGNLTPARLKSGLAMKDLVIWRETTTSNEEGPRAGLPRLSSEGALRGAILDYPSSYAAGLDKLKELREEADKRHGQLLRRKQRELERETGERLTLEEVAKRLPPRAPIFLEVNGTLSFVPVREHELKGGRRTYADALRNYADVVISPESDAVADADAERRGIERVFFLPVLLVSNQRVVTESDLRQRQRARGVGGP